MAWSKYGAKKVEADGIVFASKLEYRRYEELKLLQRAGQIYGLELQPKFPCIVNGVKICSWIGDFAYVENGHRVVEDTKGFLTPLFRIKIKLVRALYPDSDIRIITAR